MRPFLRKLDPETAHGLALRALKHAPLPRPADDEKLRVEAFGLMFPNPVGLAAGFDKHAEVIDPLLRLGFGFVEAGGVTPKPQPGNPRPRLFRLDPDEGIINRFGFNSDGVEAVAQRLAARAGAPGIVGINLGVQQGYGRPRGRLRDLHCGARPACELSHRQHLLPKHRGLAQPATGKRAR